MKHRLTSEVNPVPEKTVKRPTIEGENLCCFGMIIGLCLTISESYMISEIPIPPDLLEDSCTLIDTKSRKAFGVLDRNGRKVLEVLRKEFTLELYSDRSSSSDNLQKKCANSRNRRNSKRTNPIMALYIVLYGVPTLFDPVGHFTNSCKLFLQHPRYCSKNVPYRNPHCLSPPEGDNPYTNDIINTSYLDDCHNLELSANPIDLLADATDQEALMGTESPQALQTVLYEHQKQALTFMIQREGGWAMDGHHRDMWKEQKDAFGRVSYLNTITGQKQTLAPQQFRGGLLIDAPGLGKSLSIIALIASNSEMKAHSLCKEAFLPTTLLIVPKTLIQTWRDELQKHLRSSDALKYRVYYGKDRTKHLRELQDYALLITTYSIVQLDWKTSMGQHLETPLTLHDVKWGRVVLDEAHTIREPSKSFAKSVGSLQAEKRWAVTGTPIQNRLMDLFSLFKFLQCTPFDELKVFNSHISQNWKARSDPTSFLKLKTLVNCLSLRRPKTTIELPSRIDEPVELEFNDQEKQYYREVQSSTLHKIGLANSKNSGAIFLNTLKWVNELRLICNHGITNRKTIANLEDGPADKPLWNAQEAQARFDQLDGVGLAKCSNTECGQDLSSAVSSETDSEHDDEPWITESLELWCSSCAEQTRNKSLVFKICNHLPRKDKDSVVPDTQASRAFEPYTSAAQKKLIVEAQSDVPSKIRKVVQDLCDTRDDIKSVVFSSWTRTFDILQPQLWDRSIRCVRLDGSLTASGRAGVLRVFRNEPGIKVLLATISCGGIGLDLTVASHAYIMEPQWNPMSESQALDRIHRLGQLKEVKTIRYIMRGSWEVNVQKLQRRKQELANLTLNAGTKKEDLTYGRLQYLKELVG